MENTVYEVKAYPADQAYFSLTLGEEDYDRFRKLSDEEKQRFIVDKGVVKKEISKVSEISHYMSAKQNGRWVSLHLTIINDVYFFY